MSKRADAVVIGMDPHKRSVTIEVMTADETVLGGGRFGTDAAGLAAMRALRQPVSPDRVWAVEGCNGIGHHIAVRLLADGEQVVDVPPKLSARARVFATGQGRKTDATDAHSVALVGTRMAGLRPVVDDEQLAVLRVLVDRRRSLGEDHTRMVVPAAPAAARADPRRGEEGPVRGPGQGAAGQGPATRRRRQDPPPGRRGADHRPGADLCPQEGRRQGAHRAGRRHRHQPAGPATASDPPVPPGCWSRSATSPGSPTAATSRPGTAPHPSTPPPATRSGTGCPGPGTGRSTGSCTSWPPSNSATPPKAAPTTTARKADGKTSMEAMRGLKRRLSDIVYRPCSTTPSPTAQRGRAREGNGATTLTPARPAHIPTPALRTSHFPDPPPPSLEPHSRPRLDTEGSHERMPGPEGRVE